MATVKNNTSKKSGHGRHPLDQHEEGFGRELHVTPRTSESGSRERGLAGQKGREHSPRHNAKGANDDEHSKRHPNVTAETGGTIRDQWHSIRTDRQRKAYIWTLGQSVDAYVATSLWVPLG
jgi:hypothetical protein